MKAPLVALLALTLLASTHARAASAPQLLLNEKFTDNLVEYPAGEDRAPQQWAINAQKTKGVMASCDTGVFGFIQDNASLVLTETKISVKNGEYQHNYADDKRVSAINFLPVLTCMSYAAYFNGASVSPVQITVDSNREINFRSLK